MTERELLELQAADGTMYLALEVEAPRVDPVPSAEWDEATLVLLRKVEGS